MCVFKKPSTPSFGVKLFVSLVLLAISLCLVNCTAATTTTTVLADEVKLTVPKTEVANKLTEILSDKGVDLKKFSEHNSSYDVTTAFPSGGVAAGKPEVITTTALPAEFKVLLPVDKTIDDYIAKVVEPLTPTFPDKKWPEVQKALKNQLEKTIYDLDLKPTPEDYVAVKNFVQLETILDVNFHIDSSSSNELKPMPTPGPGPVTNAGKVLFKHVFSGTTSEFDPIVYIDTSKHSDAKNLIENCVLAANGTVSATFSSETEALKALLDQVLGELQLTGASVQWSAIVTEIGEHCLEASSKIGKTPALAGVVFDKTKILEANVSVPSSHYNKFYLDFGKIPTAKGADNEKQLIKFLVANLDSSMKNDEATAYPLLVAKASGGSAAGKEPLNLTSTPVSADDFHKEVTSKLDALKNEIDKALGDYSLLTFEATDIVPATGPFTVVTDNLECAKFPVKHVTPTATAATIDNFGDYVKNISFTSAATTDAAIKKEFLALLWKPESLETYKTSLATTVTATTPPVTSTNTTSDTTTKSGTSQVNADGAGSQTASNLPVGSDDLQSEPDQQDQPPKEQQQQPENPQPEESKGDYMWIVWTSVSIVGTAIAGVVGYFFWSRKKASNL